MGLAVGLRWQILLHDARRFENRATTRIFDVIIKVALECSALTSPGVNCVFAARYVPTPIGVGLSRPELDTERIAALPEVGEAEACRAWIPPISGPDLLLGIA